MPITRGGTPTAAPEVTRASGVSPYRCDGTSGGDQHRGRAVVDAGGVARGDGAAGDDRPQLGQCLQGGLPRVLVGSTTTASPRRCGTGTGAISRASRPAAIAFAVRSWERSANAS